MGRKLQCLPDHVEEPTKHDFGGAPTPVTLQQFLHRDRLLVEWMVRIKRVKDVINGMKQNAPGDMAMMGIALNKVAKMQ